jgi:glycosyltransferase involved in cell wall biosynthesis
LSTCEEVQSDELQNEESADFAFTPFLCSNHLHMGSAFHPLVSRSDPAMLSLVIPVYNEAAMLPILRQELTAFADTLPMACELIFVNDGSSDDSLRHLLAWSGEDPRIKIMGLARNFGHQAAVTAGLDAARGDAVVIMDADLQDPPSVILDMLREYRRGFDVVYGQRMVRHGETMFKRASAWVFYRLMQRFVHESLPIDAGDFRLISRPCLDAVRSMRETHRFLRGMVAWVGFPQTAVLYERPARAAGDTKYPLRRMLHFAWTAALSFSPAPLRISFAFGALVASLGMAIGVYAVYRKVMGLYVERGWTSQMIVTCLVGGGILLSIGVLGEYIARIFEEVKGRPLYIVSVSANINSLDSRSSGVIAGDIISADSVIAGTTTVPTLERV